METTLQPLQMAKNTRGTKRAAAAATSGQENATPAANVVGKRGASGEVTKPATRFGFRPPTALALAPTQPTANVPAAQHSKRRKTNEGAAAQEFEQPSSSAAAAAAVAASSGVCTPSRLASSSAAGLMSPSSGVSIPPVAVAGPADAIANLWRETMMDDALAGECRAALANKITATKFDYKERIGQLEAQMKSLRKVVTVLTRKQDGFLADAARIETGLQEDIAAARNRARDVMVEKAALQDKAQRALQLVKQLQAQRDTLMSDAKGAASQLSQHAAVMDAAQALQLDTENKLTQVTSDLQVTVQLLDETTSEREQAKQLLVELQEQLDAAGQQLAVLEEERNDLRAANEEQAASIEAAQTANAQMETQLSATREQYVALMAQWSTLQKSFEKSEENSANLEKSIASLRAELAHAREAHESSRAELAAQALQASDAKTKSVSEMSSLRASLHAEMAALRHQMEESLARNAEESASLQSTIEQLQSSKTSLQDSLTRSAGEVTSLRGSLMHATEKQGSTEVELRKVEGELALVKMQLAQKNEECFVTVSSFANIQKFHEERQTILQQEKESLEKRMLDLGGKVLSLEGSNKTLQGALDTTTQSLEQRSKELESLRAEHDKATAQAKEDRENWEQSEAGLKAALATLTAESSAQVSKLESQVSELTAKYSEEHSRATNLSRELTSFKALSGVSSESQMENLVKLSMEAETLRLQVKDKGDLSVALMETKAALAEALKKVAEGDATRRALHNSIQELKGNIRVFTRVRPLLQAGSKVDVNSGEANSVSGEDAVSAIDVSTDGKKLRLDMGNGAPRSSFAFDAVFGPATTQKELFDEVSPFVQSALDGYHICLFSYGQTGAGKTWSMSGGSGEQRGIIPRSVEKVLEQAQALSAGGWTYTLEAAYLEIYNETIRDLLCKDSKESDLDIKRDISGRTNIPGLTRCPVSSINDVTALMAKAARNRSTASTNMNERSSRSHSVFTLYLSATNPHSKQSLAGSLNLCDLAGSERLSKSGASGDRMKETQSINKSLSSLSDVFMALSQKQAHVPFRNSKLTYLLQPCLSGDGKTAMIINLNPSLSSSNESLCTLRFAAQVSQVELGKPKKQTKTTYDDPMDTSAAPAISAAAASPRPSLTGSASSSGLMRPTTASSATKKVAASTIPRPSTGTAMRR